MVEETIKNIGEGIFDFCYMTPSTYIEARNKYDVQVIASALNEGKPFHYSVIVTREGSNIKDVEDIKGCSFAFGDSRWFMERITVKNSSAMEGGGAGSLYLPAASTLNIISPASVFTKEIFWAFSLIP